MYCVAGKFKGWKFQLNKNFHDLMNFEVMLLDISITTLLLN